MLSIRAFTLLLLLSVWSTFGQQDFLRGRLLDAQTQEPIPFATVRVKGYALGVISNSDGGFQIPQRFKDLGGDLVISCMGYETREIPLAAFLPDQIAIVRLGPGVLQLSEAVVRAEKKRRLSAIQIVRRAIKAIPENYPMRAFATIGYYRDYQLKKDKYVNLNEAILEVTDLGFGSYDHLSSKVRIYDYQSNKTFAQDFRGKFKYDYKSFNKFIDKAYLYGYGGNEFTILRIHDAIRNYKVNSFDFVNVLERDLVDNHFFKKEEDIRQDDEVLYTITFRQSLQKYLAYGKMYISKKDYAIHKMEYVLYDRFRKSENGQINKHGDNLETIFEVAIEYKRDFGKMFPNYISFYNTFEVSQPPEFVVKEVFLDGPRGCFVVRFNDFVDIKTAERKANYDIRFEGEKIEVKRVKVFDIEVELYPELGNGAFTVMVGKLAPAQNKRLDLMKMLSAEVTEVLNKRETAKVNEMKYQTYRQFREYFVQEIRPNGIPNQDTLFMKKYIPIFEDQPISKPDNFKDYWMNTPLQKVEN
ncbi:MAG: carboxypeptidase-like regulatory domain-containing protein [Flavobacteriaceae bacterium]